MPIKSFVPLFSAMLAFSLAACGGGGDTSAPVGEAPAASPLGVGSPHDEPPPGEGSQPKLPPLIRYFKASNTGAGDWFGGAVALSADGKTLAVGACFEASNATGVNGNQLDNSEAGAGAVYIFTRGAAAWSQHSYLKASNAEEGSFGCALALSADGSVLAVGAPGESSNATGINGNQWNNSATQSGAVYVFKRNHGVWSQEAYVKASNTGAHDLFGGAVALSADGERLAVGARLEDSSATGIGGNQADNAAVDSGAVYLFERHNVFGWVQKEYIKASNTDAHDGFGTAVALNADGRTLAVGARGESSNATGINGNQADNSIWGAGAAYVFHLSGRFSGGWSQQAYLKASNNQNHSENLPPHGYIFGHAIALSADGDTLAVGAVWDASNTTGIDGSQADNSMFQAGAAYIFKRSASNWTQQAYIKASNTDDMDQFGYAIALSADGSTLAVGAVGEGSNATGVNGQQSDESAGSSGAVYVYVSNARGWTQKAYVKASNTGTGDWFGRALALSEDGSTLAVGAVGEDSNATGINGNQKDNSASEAGAVYVVTNM